MTPTRLATAALTAIALVVALAVAAPAHADPVVATGSAGDVTAWDGGLAWSVRTAPGTFALMVLRGQVATRAPIAPDSEPFYATTGTDHNGDPVLVYVRCRGGCNAAYAYWPASGTERRLVHAGHGCQVRDPSIDHGALSFVRYMRSCRARGVLRPRPAARRDA